MTRNYNSISARAELRKLLLKGDGDSNTNTFTKAVRRISPFSKKGKEVAKNEAEHKNSD